MSISPAMNSGLTILTIDPRGELRDIEPDIGAYEYQGSSINLAIIMYLLN